MTANASQNRAFTAPAQTVDGMCVRNWAFRLPVCVVGTGAPIRGRHRTHSHSKGRKQCGSRLATVYRAAGTLFMQPYPVGMGAHAAGATVRPAKPTAAGSAAAG